MNENDISEVYDFYVPSFFDESGDILSDVSGGESTDNVLDSDSGDNLLDNSDIVDSLSSLSESIQGIQESVNVLIDNEIQVPSSRSIDRAISVDYLDGYYFKYQGEYVYIPIDKIDYFTLTNNGELLNLSSGTVTCYSLDTSGNVRDQYRFSPFSKAQKYVYGYDGQQYQHWYWTDIYVDSTGSNMTFGQTGISGIENFLLFGILFFVGIIALFRKGR